MKIAVVDKINVVVDRLLVSIFFASFVVSVFKWLYVSGKWELHYYVLYTSIITNALMCVF